MTEQPRTRQDLYDRIRQSSKEAFILEEMVRLGFWPAEGEMPNDPVDEIRRRSELQQEINALRQESRNLQDEKVLRQRLRAERLAESRRKRQETKERRERERRERAEAWKQRQQKDIVFLGERVSGGLNETESDRDRLAHNDLPYFGTAAEIATGMNISVGELRFLAFDRPVSRVTHYQRFAIAKKTGGQREISAPMP
ncbi:MAG: RNA-directed DNA polymerase, partial [Cyanobacteria bacterium J06639_1]